jgi:hypothetical protein
MQGNRQRGLEKSPAQGLVAVRVRYDLANGKGAISKFLLERRSKDTKVAV